MNQKPGTFIILSSLVLVMAATVCELTFIENENDLEAAIIAQNTILAELNTQVAERPKMDRSIGDDNSYLSTQMPLALKLNTPIQEGIRITPTPSMDIEYPSVPAPTSKKPIT